MVYVDFRDEHDSNLFLLFWHMCARSTGDGNDSESSMMSNDNALVAREMREVSDD